MKDLVPILNELKVKLQLQQIQMGPLEAPITINFYEKWLQKNYHAEMGYLQTHLAVKKRPQNLNEEFKSVITISQPYFPLVTPTEEKMPARIATYAQNKDYHFWLKEKLNVIISELQILYPDQHFAPYVDSGPILERNWAFENGLGWFGKNSCLIHPDHGSLFFIAEILSTLSPTEAELRLEPLPDFCGTCTRCLDICPTNAIIEPKVVQAELCISYLTIESKTIPPVELREKIGDWFFGCDLCQTVCPWNEKAFRQKKIPRDNDTSTALLLPLAFAEREKIITFFRMILTSSNKKIVKTFVGSPLLRAGGNGLKRNALIVIANQKLHELTDEVRLHSENAKLAELAQWCLLQLVKN